MLHGRSGSVALPLTKPRPARPALFEVTDTAADRRAVLAAEFLRSVVDIMQVLPIGERVQSAWQKEEYGR